MFEIVKKDLLFYFLSLLIFLFLNFILKLTIMINITHLINFQKSFITSSTRKKYDINKGAICLLLKKINEMKGSYYTFSYFTKCWNHKKGKRVI